MRGQCANELRELGQRGVHVVSAEAVQSRTPLCHVFGAPSATQHRVRLAEQVALETRTRTLNPRWYEGQLKHGYEGVRQIEAQVTNTMGWSATTGQVAAWVYQRISETFVLDAEMRARLAELNPTASSRMAKRLIEACDRNFWTPDEDTLRALHEASDELEDRLEGVPAAA